MIQESFCPVSPYMTLTLTDCTEPWFLCFIMFNVWSSQQKGGKGRKSLFTQFPSGFSRHIQPSHLRNSAGRAVRLSIPWTGRLARCSLQGGEWRSAQFCRCSPWDGLALTKRPQLAASPQLTHSHLSSVLWDAAHPAAVTVNTTCTTKMKKKDEEKAPSLQQA